MKCKICGSKTRVWYKNLFDDRHGYPGKFNVYRCQNCGFGQSVPQLSSKKIAKIYSEYYPWKQIDTSKVKRNDFKMPSKNLIWRKGLYINGQYKVKPLSKVLDIGCGMGFSLLELESIKCKAYGIDPDMNAAKLAKRFGLKFQRGFITDKPFGNEKFDYIIANQVLEHTNDPIKFLKECKKRLSTNGKIILSFPNTNSLTRYLLKKNWLHWHIPYHLNFFTRDSIKILAEKSNLKINSLETLTPNMWTNLQIRRLTQKPKIGKRDEFWDGKGEKNKILNTGYITRLVHALEEYNYLNRIIDFLGLGESFSVTLSIA